MSSIEEIKGKRFQFLCRLYRLSGGNELKQFKNNMASDYWLLGNCWISYLHDETFYILRITNII